MDHENDNNSFFALTARSTGEPSKLYTPITVLNPRKDAILVAEANAMWDTGAEVCVISKSLAEALRLKMAPGPAAHGLTGTSESEVCFAYVSFVAGGGIITVKCAVVDHHIGGVEYSIILGLNLIRRGSLAITGGDKGITLSSTLPASSVVDFTAIDTRKPGAIVNLSDGPEEIKIYSGLEAIKIMNRAIPDFAK